MGIFDFFTKEVDRPKDARGKQAAVIGKPINSRESNGGAMQVFHPRSFDDVQKIIETLKANKPAIVYLNTLKRTMHSAPSICYRVQYLPLTVALCPLKRIFTSSLSTV